MRSWAEGSRPTAQRAARGSHHSLTDSAGRVKAGGSGVAGQEQFLGVHVRQWMCARDLKKAVEVAQAQLVGHARLGDWPGSGGGPWWPGRLQAARAPDAGTVHGRDGGHVQDGHGERPTAAASSTAVSSSRARLPPSTDWGRPRGLLAVGDWRCGSWGVFFLVVGGDGRGCPAPAPAWLGHLSEKPAGQARGAKAARLAGQARAALCRSAGYLYQASRLKAV